MILIRVWWGKVAGWGRGNGNPSSPRWQAWWLIADCYNWEHMLLWLWSWSQYHVIAGGPAQPPSSPCRSRVTHLPCILAGSQWDYSSVWTLIDNQISLQTRFCIPPRRAGVSCNVTVSERGFVVSWTCHTPLVQNLNLCVHELSPPTNCSNVFSLVSVCLSLSETLQLVKTLTSKVHSLGCRCIFMWVLYFYAVGCERSLLSETILHTLFRKLLVVLSNGMNTWP